MQILNCKLLSYFPLSFSCVCFCFRYADKDEETRDRKLQRKFDKMDETERRIYENIAAKNA